MPMRGRGRGRRWANQNAENIEDWDELEEIIEESDERCEALRREIAELRAQSEVRGQFLKAYSDDLGVMWRDIMDPESCTEDEPESEDEPGPPNPSIPSSDDKRGQSAKSEETDQSSSSSSNLCDEDNEKSKSQFRKRKSPDQESSETHQTEEIDSSEIAESSDEKIDAVPSTSNSNVDMKQSNPSKPKNFQKSLTRIMFEWAREQPEFEINMQNLRDEKFRNEDDLEKFAFFQLFEKRNAEYRAEQDRQRELRVADWEKVKLETKLSFQNSGKSEEEFHAWLVTEQSRRVRKNFRRKKREVKRLRIMYLEDRDDEIFPDKPTALEATFGQQLPTPNQTMDNVEAEDASNDSDVGQFQARKSEVSTNNVPTKRARTLR